VGHDCRLTGIHFPLKGKIMISTIRVAFFIFLFTFLAASGFPAEKPGTLSRAKEAIHPAEQEKGAEDPLGRSTPQGTVFGFIKSASQGENDRAVQYLDSKKTGPGAQTIIHALQVILERGFSGKLGMLSNKPEGNLDDDLPPTKERIGTVETSSGRLDIVLERMQRGSGPPIWLFSAATLAKVPEIYQELDVRTLEDYLPKFLVDTWFLWFPLWRWVAILLGLPLTFVLATFLTRLITRLLWLYSRRHFEVQGRQPLARLAGPIRILIFALAIWVISLVSKSILASAFWAWGAATLSVVGTTWLLLRFIDIFFELKERQWAGASPDKLSLLHWGKKLVKILGVMIGAIFIFYIAGINLTAVIAGLGVGGIAVALAAQKTLENLISGITLATDQPIRVGDTCRAGEYQGTVLTVGLRSTRVRTLARTVVAIPNGQLAQMSLENFSLRDKIWFRHTLGLRYETTAEQLRSILAEIREMLYGHPKVESASGRVRFIGFGSSSLDLEVFAYVLETDYGAFLAIQEDLLLRIMDIVAANGSGFAFPSQTMYLSKDSGMDEAKRQEAIRKVREWREKGELPFPDFSPETIAKIDNRIEYPPPDSAGRNKKA
jgi:MscS family membrane protein